MKAIKRATRKAEPELKFVELLPVGIATPKYHGTGYTVQDCIVDTGKFLMLWDSSELPA